MPLRGSLLILALLAVPSLTGCDNAQESVPPPPASELSLKAISGNPGVSRELLGQQVDRLFDAETVGDTRALLIERGGEIVAERYGKGYGRTSPFNGWSMSHCVTGILIGMLVSDGRLRMDETAPVPGWQRSGDPRGEITIRQLLQMRSGLRHAEESGEAYPSDRFRMLYLSGRDDMSAYAEAQPLEAEPGRMFEFSSATPVILADIAARSLTASREPEDRRIAASNYLRSRLFDPAGMDSMVLEFDRAGTMVSAGTIHGTARDWARLGEFLRNSGSVKGAQLISRRWIEFMRRPSPRNDGYGAMLWLNNPQPDGTERLFGRKAPASLFACLGEEGQYVIASPEQKLTVVRLGNTPKDRQAELQHSLGDLLALFPVR